jgi:hypothetical protein
LEVKSIALAPAYLKELKCPVCGASIGLGLEVKAIEVKEAKVKTIEARNWLAWLENTGGQLRSWV